MERHGNSEAGYRNPYDLGSTDRNLAYDADMEWDFGMPVPTNTSQPCNKWKRTGWRSGTKWPAAYPDSLPAMIDIGPGSPVGAAFGYGAKILPSIRKLFISATGPWDHAIHLTPWFNIYSRERGICTERTSFNRYDYR